MVSILSKDQSSGIKTSFTLTQVQEEDSGLNTSSAQIRRPVTVSSSEKGKASDQETVEVQSEAKVSSSAHTSEARASPVKPEIENWVPI